MKMCNKQAKISFLLFLLTWTISGFSQSEKVELLPEYEILKADVRLKSAAAGPNLTPIQPSGWDDKIVLSTVQNTSTSAASFLNTQTIYLDWAVMNNGTEQITQLFTVKIFVDDKLQVQYSVSGLNVSFYVYDKDLAIGPLTGGSHTIKVIADAGNTVSETSETDNEYSRTITVQTLIIPDIFVSPQKMIISQSGTQSLPVRENLLQHESVSYIPSVPDSLKLGQYTDPQGNVVDMIRISGVPPRDFRIKSATIADGGVLLDNFPAYRWSFGCSPTAAAMIAGYYDLHGYPEMYSGPANGGAAPLTNNIWGIAEINGEINDLCPLSATRNGQDGRTIRGHVDDYWVKTGSSAQDPYITNGWTQHVHGECTGDFMKSNQSAYSSVDGSTTFFYSSNGPYTGTNSRDGGYGFQLFMESRGYTVTTRYNQYILGYQGSTSGFTYEQYIAEIDAGRPVLIHLTNHSVAGVGYDKEQNLIFLHDTWDNNVHSMTWGGSYAGLNHYAVSVFHLSPSNLLTINNIGTGNLSISFVGDNKDWLTFSPEGPFSLTPGAARSLLMEVDWTRVYGSSDVAVVTIQSDDPDEPVSTVEVTAIPAPCSLTVTPANQTVQATPAGTVTFSVETACGWIASSDQTWCTVTPSGTGNSSITAGYQVNTTGATRTATITVTSAGHAPVAVTVVQSPGFTSCIGIEAYIFLEGSLLAEGSIFSFGSEMRTTLNDKLMLPGQTYKDRSGVLIYTPAGQPYDQLPWEYNGPEGSAFDSQGVEGDGGYAGTVVDWVLVSLRSSVGGAPLCRKAALLYKDGTLELPGGSGCCNLDPLGSYYLVVEHRNHLIVMSDKAVPVINGKLTYDFRIQQSYLDPLISRYVGQKKVNLPLGTGYVMYAGNGSQVPGSTSADTDITGDDQKYWTDRTGRLGYLNSDYNMNGDSNADDQTIWERSNGITTGVPRN